MKQYSILQESDSVNKILAVTGMTALGDKGGGFVGSNIGNAIASTKYKKIDPDSISWSDQEFLDLVRKTLQKAKEDITLKREWYLSCNKEEKQKAKEEYLRALEEYKTIQQEINERNPYRWLTQYKQMKIKKFTDRSKTIGKIAGSAIGGVGTTLSFLNKKI